jgi:hypothetical protein
MKIGHDLRILDDQAGRQDYRMEGFAQTKWEITLCSVVFHSPQQHPPRSSASPDMRDLFALQHQSDS